MKCLARATVVLLVLFSCRSAAAQSGPDDPPMIAFRNGAFAEAMTGWMRAADGGDGQAARFVGVLFDTGEGVAQNQATALDWYQRAAALGDVPAMFNVAVCFDAGRGTARDPVQAAVWYRRAAQHRFGRAEYNLALMQQQGDGVTRDRRAAQILFRAALRDGITAARLHLPDAGVLPRGGDGALPHGGGALHATASQPGAATQDAAFASAQQALLGRSPEDASRAAALFTRAADGNGSAASMARYDLAWCLQNGIGVPLDRPRAYDLFIRVAAETADPLLGRLARAAAERASRLSVTVSTATRPAAPGTQAGSREQPPD